MMPESNKHESGTDHASATILHPPGSSRRDFKRWALGLTLGISAVGLTGCTMLGGLQQKLNNSECIDDFMISHRNKVMAARAWLRVKHCYHGHAYLKDLQAGFIAGYLEVATGGSGCTPTVVSPQYWGWRHQSGNGQAAVNAWFEGFPLGVKAAEQDGIGHYNMIRLNAVPHMTTNMTGTAVPTPAAVAPVLMPQSVPQPLPPASGHPLPSPAGLPAGIILGEGETLVPGEVTIEEIGTGAAVPTKPITPPKKDASTQPSDAVTPPVQLRDNVPGLDKTPEPNGPPQVPLTDPFADEVRRRESKPTTNSFSIDDVSKSAPGKDASSPVADALPLELVPRTPTSTTTRRLELPTGQSPQADQPSTEPSQAEIDKVIEEIFGKPSALAPK